VYPISSFPQEYRFLPNSLVSGFIPKWTDEFGTLNATRWEASTHTFDAQFKPNNAAIVKAEETDPLSDGSYLSLSITDKNATIDVLPPDFQRPTYDEFNVKPLEWVYDDWNPPSKSYLLESEVCKGEGVTSEPGKRYEGGWVTFTTVLVEGLPNFGNTRIDETDAVQKCTAMCVDHYNSSECRFFTVFSVESTQYCSGFMTPERERSAIALPWRVSSAHSLTHRPKQLSPQPTVIWS